MMGSEAFWQPGWQMTASDQCSFSWMGTKMNDLLKRSTPCARHVMREWATGEVATHDCKAHVRSPLTPWSTSSRARGWPGTSAEPCQNAWGRGKGEGEGRSSSSSSRKACIKEEGRVLERPQRGSSHCCSVPCRRPSSSSSSLTAWRAI